MKVVTAAQMQSLDRRAQAEYGVSADELMLEAGRAVSRRVREHFNPEKVIIVCGKGNNAGDGFVVAHELTTVGVEVLVLLVEPGSQFSGAALAAFQRLAGTRVRVTDFEETRSGLSKCDLIIDALLGTGTSGPPRPRYAAAIEAINNAHRPVIAIDIPSGLQEPGVSTEGGPIVTATATVTIGLPKLALLMFPGVVHAGRILIEPVNFPSPLLTDSAIQVDWAEPAELRAWVPARPPDANKGTFGSVAVVAGSAPFAGAAILISRGALRTGCGLVYIVTTAQQNPIYKAALPEAVSIVSQSKDPDWLDAAAMDELLKSLERMSALVIGPGLGTNGPQCELVQSLLSNNDLPAILDADALTCISRDPGCAAAVCGRANTLLTPHPGELARLLDTSAEVVQSDRVGFARGAAAKFQIPVLLKGVSTLVAEPTGRVYIIPGACSALAKGGTGDVLAGAIGALVAQGAPVTGAAVVAAQVHLMAGEECARRYGSRGVLASEVADEIPRALDRLCQE